MYGNRVGLPVMGSGASGLPAVGGAAGGMKPSVLPSVLASPLTVGAVGKAAMGGVPAMALGGPMGGGGGVYDRGVMAALPQPPPTGGYKPVSLASAYSSPYSQRNLNVNLRPIWK
jgi:hypothetical protein